MKKLLKMEIYEATHNNIYLLMIGIAIVYGVYSGYGDLEENFYNLSLGGYEVLLAMLHDAPGTCMLISAFPALLIGKSFSNRTLITKVASGNSRGIVFFTKAVSILIITTVSMLIYSFSGAFAVTIKYGFNAPSGVNVITLMKILICTILLYLAIFSVIILFGVIFRDNLKTIIVSVITILMNAIYLFVARSMNLPLYRHPMNLLRVILNNNSTFEFISFSLEGIILLGFIIMLSYNIFCKCELK
ncbi:ABC transporter permease [Clostridium beijerinckii]|uniref:ABC transporter permease n=1 Tax=Clostridium beijerinckii TaxID=1520 RepID=A0A7X9SQR0_CLOBE|nr:ABC transporter permease [Clostridium beijerinckii]NMF06366.1 ABC transporter permease [Clostridium beijerinckii]